MAKVYNQHGFIAIWLVDDYEVAVIQRLLDDFHIANDFVPEDQQVINGIREELLKLTD